MRLRTGLLALLAGGALALGGGAVTAPRAEALCWNYGCDGSNPQTTGCSGSAINAAYDYFDIAGSPNMGLVEARYSRSCVSQWTRGSFTPTAYQYPSLSQINIHGTHGTRNGAVGSGTNSWYTAQLGALNNQYYSSVTFVMWGGYYGSTPYG